MAHISTQQREVVKRFKSEVTHMLDPDAAWQNMSARTPIRDLNGVHLNKGHDDYFRFSNTADELPDDIDDPDWQVQGTEGECRENIDECNFHDGSAGGPEPRPD